MDLDLEQQFIHKIMEQYQISNTHGCLLSTMPALPEKFKSLLRIAGNLPDLLETRGVRKLVDELPLIETEDLIGYELLRHAHLVLSLVTNCYVWQDGESHVPQCIPKQLAVPLMDISRRVNLPPVVTHADLVLANVLQEDNSKPLKLGNMKLKYRISGDLTCDWFFLATAEVELAILPAINTMLTCQWCMENNLTERVTAQLQSLSGIIENLRLTFIRMHEQLDADKFYNVIRPYLNGWHTDGMVYEGVSEHPIKAYGGSAAQCMGIQALDIFLGVQHKPDKMKFLLEMRDYMPAFHREFLIHLESIHLTSQFVTDHPGDEKLRLAFNNCVQALTKLRSTHIQMVVKYITIPVSRRRNNNFDSLKKQGTGGQELLPFLRNIRSTTQAAEIGEGSSQPTNL